MVQVSSHDVGAAQINLFAAVILEIVDPAVLQEAADNTRDPNILANSIDAGTQRTNPADQQIDLYAGLRRLVQQPDHPDVFKRVHLESQPRGPALLGMGDFAANQL